MNRIVAAGLLAAGLAAGCGKQDQDKKAQPSSLPPPGPMFDKAKPDPGRRDLPGKKGKVQAG